MRHGQGAAADVRGSWLIVVLLVLLDSAAGPPAWSQDLDTYLDSETVALAEGYDKRLRYAPSVVIIFDEQDIERTGALNVAELLERIIGIHLSRKSFGSSADQFVRGLDGNLLVLHNGIEIAKQLPELLTMPLVDLKRVEVIKGSHYPPYGESASFGTVNLVTKEPTGDEFAGGVRGGSLNTRQGWVRVSDIVGRIGYSAYVSHLETTTTEGQIVVDRQTPLDQALGTNASFAPGEGYFGAEVTDARLTLELGRRWTFRQFVNRRTMGTGVGLAQALDPFGEERVSRYTSDLRFESPLGEGTLEARFTYNRTEAEYADTRLLPPGTLGGLFPDGVIQSYGQSGQQVFGEALYRIVLGNHTIDVGAGARWGEVDNDFDRRNYVFEAGNDIPTPLGETVDFTDTAPLFRDDYSVTERHLILRDEVRLTTSLSAHVGARVDYATDRETFVNPRLGLDWVAGQYTNVFLLYGESGSSASEIQQTSNGLFSPLGSEDLERARTRILELAFDHRFGNGILLSSNIYTYRQSNSIGVVPDDDVPIGTRFANLDEEQTGSGIESRLDWRVHEKLALALGAAYQKRDSSDLEDVGAPSFQPYAEANVGSLGGWHLNVAAIGVAGRERAADDDRPELDDYTLVNLALTRRDFPIGGVNLSFSAQNLFDADAREDISEAIVFDLPVYPQRFLLGIEYQGR